MTLAVARPWFKRAAVSDRLTRITEPHVDELLRANIWHLAGRDHDLIVDTGLGVGWLRDELPELFVNNPIVVLTHGHLDHAGGASEFDSVYAHPGDRADRPDPAAASLDRQTLLAAIGLSFEDEPGPAGLIGALPRAGYDIATYAVHPPRAIQWLADGDTLELGDRALEVLHVPGHSPGSIALYDAATGWLFTGDCVYDDVLLDSLTGSSIPDYFTSMNRLRALPVATVYAGHGEPFDQVRLHQLIDAYLASRKVS